MMRILQILLFPLQGSGSGTYADRLAEFEQARGHTVKVLCCDHVVPQRRYETAALVFKSTAQSAVPGTCDLNFNFPAFTTHPLSTSTTFGSLSDDQRERYVAAFHRKICEEVALFKPDIVHAHHGWVIGAALADLDVPYVISLHGTEHYGFLHYPAYRELALKGLRKADRVLALTEGERVKAIETYELDPDRVIAIASGVDTTLFKPLDMKHSAQRAAALRTRRERSAARASTSLRSAQHARDAESKNAVLPFTARYGDRPIIFAASKHTAIKGTDVLLRAAAIYSRIPERPLTLIAGEGSERVALEALRDELNLLDDVIFLGWQNATQMMELYNAADVTVLASRTDWFPLVVIESLACGTPVIASDVGGLSQLVTPNIGRLFSSGDYATLAAYVTDFIRSDFKVAAHTACVQHVRERFSWDKTVDRIVAVYQEVLTETDKVTR
jgi:glycosyltransferase involved in cell wall biosynthesis